ncbi:NAD(P)H-dependent oxidoreductase [Ligilactobacillus equi]|uniref:Oxidoreductase n=2 Tax=Ligilactobacillus equi TaxID=137357 RepID=V7HUL5_9LACO|nr:NAD(P)H-dependent oxidoreductase [Ligilactobacillus equi]ETA73889.1 oxidoreductase [Ligilactobacillus equi DPC 6820]KRL79457.1 nadph-dependent fmn reductase domain protein [Ligilactobacillus equi DSM 15833 = JCM 10991]MCQ2556519.1 NAD(P)H-dependent oxidoreductase [Ligilactobacillus sp.]
MKLVGIAGSIAEESYNKKLLQFIQKQFPELNLEILDIKDVPMFNEGNDQSNSEVIQYLNKKVKEADGVILATPEHNHTTTAALKSVIEWLSFNLHPFKEKPVLLVGASYRTQGTSRAQLSLRQILESPGVNALVMPSDEFLLGNAKTAFDEEGNLNNEGTVNFLTSVINKFTKWVKVLKAVNIKEVKNWQDEDMTVSSPIDTTIQGVEPDDPEWVEKAAKITKAASGSDFVKLDRGVLSVDQLNWFLNSMPFELTYADDNNQFLYYNHMLEAKDMLAARTPDQAGDSLENVHPERAKAGAKRVINMLRNGDKDVKMLVPGWKKNGPAILHYYGAMTDDDGRYRGINEIVLDLWPVVQYYLKATGQMLVDDPNAADASSGASAHGAAPATPTPAADATSGASEEESSEAPVFAKPEVKEETPLPSVEDVATDATSGASEA